MLVSKHTLYPMDKDIHLMHQALQLAEGRRGFCAPNPAVGAVVVKGDRILATGVHWACGHPHAEAAALNQKVEAKGATLYVTLEPCSHYGRTPPCTELIIRCGIREVIYGMGDPNLQVSGQGAAVLQRAGIICRHLPCPKVDNFYQSYRYWLSQRRPWVTAKLAMSLDGKIAGFQGEPVNLTGVECQRLTHQQRQKSDAILTTATTIIADDPKLNVRLVDEAVIAKPLYILDSQLRLPLNARVLNTAKSVTLFHSDKAPAEKRERLRQMHVQCIVVDSDHQGLNLAAILAIIGKEGHHDLWVEAGGRCFQSFLSQHLAQRVFIYIAPKFLGSTATPAFSSPFACSVDPTQFTWNPHGADMVAEINLSAIVL